MAIASNTLYGSDKSGLIFGYLFEPNASGRPVNGGEAVKWLAHDRERRTGGFLWLHYDLANVATEKWLLEHLELSSAFFEAVHEGSRATRIDYADDALVAIVNDVLYSFSFEATAWGWSRRSRLPRSGSSFAGSVISDATGHGQPPAPNGISAQEALERGAWPVGVPECVSEIQMVR